MEDSNMIHSHNHMHAFPFVTHLSNLRLHYQKNPAKNEPGGPMVTRNMQDTEQIEL